MRLVAGPGEMASAWERARSEAKKFFGDDTVYLEKAITTPRHVEIQVLGDQDGRMIHVFERDCSVQRRNQKVIEESPSPAAPRDLVERMGAIAVRGASSVGYFSAGTFEFLLAGDGSFYFLEMNTRLQVEHPVTELVTGLDLVREMVRVAQGEALGFAQEDVELRGAAIECRVYAEDPATFLPSPGVIDTLVVPAGPGVRDDGGAYAGCTISSHYDPLISKLGRLGADPSARAIARMRRALSEVRRHRHSHEPRDARSDPRPPRVRRGELRHRLPRAAQGRANRRIAVRHGERRGRRRRARGGRGACREGPRPEGTRGSAAGSMGLSPRGVAGTTAARAERMLSVAQRASRFHVTTPIWMPDVNDVPHIGTSYTTIVADALRRYHLLRGHTTRMLTGTDEHGLKIEREAQARGVSPAAFVDQMSARFAEAWPKLEVQTDDFVRTTQERHQRRAQELWSTIEQKGDLYEGNYEGWYCYGCEGYKTEKDLLPGNVCPLHNRPVDWLKEDTYFFRLSKYAEPLLALYRDNPSFIQPESRRNEVVSFVEAGLKDLSVSRTSFSPGHPRAGPPAPRHVRVVRRAHELLVGCCRATRSSRSSGTTAPWSISSARTSSASTPSTGRRSS